jgi:hypothetical protein
MKTTHDNTPSSTELTITDLYAELAEQRAAEAYEGLRLVPARAALAWGSDCLAETVAHLRNYATHVLPDGERSDWIEALVRQLLCAAASFELEADTLSGSSP